MSYSPEIGFTFRFTLKPNPPQYLKQIMRSTATEFTRLPRELRSKKNKQLYHVIPALFLNKGADTFRDFGQRYEKDNVYVGSGSMLIETDTVIKLLTFLNKIKKHLVCEPFVSYAKLYSCEDHFLMGSVINQFGDIQYSKEHDSFFAAVWKEPMIVKSQELDGSEKTLLLKSFNAFEMYIDYDPVFTHELKETINYTVIGQKLGFGSSHSFLLEGKNKRKIAAIVNKLEEDTFISVAFLEVGQVGEPGKSRPFPNNEPKIYKAPEILTPHFPKNVMDILSTALFSLYNGKLVVSKGITQM